MADTYYFIYHAFSLSFYSMAVRLFLFICSFQIGDSDQDLANFKDDSMIKFQLQKVTIYAIILI